MNEEMLYEMLVDKCAMIAFHTWDKFCHTPTVLGEPQLDRALRGFKLVARAIISEVNFEKGVKDAQIENEKEEK